MQLSSLEGMKPCIFEPQDCEGLNPKTLHVYAEAADDFTIPHGKHT